MSMSLLTPVVAFVTLPKLHHCLKWNLDIFYIFMALSLRIDILICDCVVESSEVRLFRRICRILSSFGPFYDFYSVIRADCIVNKCH